jgi:hypothetical protein
MDRLDDLLEALVAATHEPSSALHFTPLRLRPRIDGWTPDRQRLYVAAIAATGRADRAAALCGMSGQTAARLRHRPDAASFSAACCAAFGFAKRLRRARLAKGSKGSDAPGGFSPMGSGPSGRFEPSAPQ